VRRLLTISAFLGIAIRIAAQVDCFAEVALDRHSVYIQQPFRVTITVLTSTWYTAPLEFDNIQVPGAFLLKFDRTIPGIFYRHNKQYAGLQFYFIVFPYNPGELTFPSFDIVAHTGATGSSKSAGITISTKPQKVLIRPIPEAEKDGWLVAKEVSITQHWSRSLRGLKVGDVVERTVVIRAAGTLPQFIPPLQPQPLDFAGSYLQDAQLKDLRNQDDANGLLTQRIIYLLEKEGDFTLPEIPVIWWNPNSNRSYSRSAARTTIHIDANPALGMLSTIKDSIASLHKPVMAARKHVLRVLGMPWYAFAFVLLSALLATWTAVRTLVNFYHRYQRRRTAWLASEAYAFRRLMRANGTLPSLIKAMYAWWDKTLMSRDSLSIIHGLHKNRYTRLRMQLDADLWQWYKIGSREPVAGSDFKKELKIFRKEMREKQLARENTTSWCQRSTPPFV
jgi:hypothetical protein